MKKIFFVAPLRHNKQVNTYEISLTKFANNNNLQKGDLLQIKIEEHPIQLELHQYFKKDKSNYKKMFFIPKAFIKKYNLKPGPVIIEWEKTICQHCGGAI